MMDEFGFDVNPLHQACALGNKQKLDELIANGENVCLFSDDRKANLLHIAAEYGQESILTTLLDTPKVVEDELILAEDHEGDTPFHIGSNNLEVFKLLFNELTSRYPGKHVDSLLNKEKQTPLHYAAGTDCLPVVEFLLGEDVKADKLARDSYGAIPFHFGARCGSIPVMKALMDEAQGVDVENALGRTALHYASWNGHKEAVVWLLDQGASVYKTDKNGDTALHWAARRGPSQVLFTLIEKNADLFAANIWSQLAIGLALDGAQEDAITQLVNGIFRAMQASNSNKHRHSIFMARYKDDATLLHYAAGYGTSEAANWFFQQARYATVRKKDGKDTNYRSIVNKGDTNGNTPFHWAAIKGNTQVIATLKARGVKPLTPNNEERNPLMLSLINNHLEFAESLRSCLGEDFKVDECVADINTWIDTFIDEDLIEKFRLHLARFDDKDIKKEMPVMYKALYARKEDTAKFVQKIKNVVNECGEKTGRTAVHWAAILGQKEIIGKLCQLFPDDVVAHVADNLGKTPLYYASDAEIARALIKRPAVQAYVDSLHRDRQTYVQACNAILVGATLISSVTFAGWLHPPDNDNLQYSRRRHWALRMFWIFNELSFFFAIATVVASASAVLPVPYKGIANAVTSIKNSLFFVSALMACSILFVSGAFAAAGFVLLPQSSAYTYSMVAGIAFGGVLCLICVGIFAVGIYKVLAFPTNPEAQPAGPRIQPSKTPQPVEGYKWGRRHEYLPWDDGLNEKTSSGATS